MLYTQAISRARAYALNYSPGQEMMPAMPDRRGTTWKGLQIGLSRLWLSMIMLVCIAKSGDYVTALKTTALLGKTKAAQKRKGKDRVIALCYERLSFSRNGADEISPKRQREHNLRVCKLNGWEPEIYADTEGHKSGRFVKNRPGWQSLEARLADDDVVALVAYDLARLHRKGWRIGKLLDVLEENDVRLVLSDPERHVDTSTKMGKIFIQFMAMADEYYAEDLAIRARGSIRGRKEKGITVSMPPFGTVRNKRGYLVPRSDGVWLLENGELVAGRKPK